MLRRMVALLAALLMASGAGIAVAPAASAAAVGISVTVTTSQCPKGGTVSRVNVTVNDTGSTGSSWTGNTVSGLTAFTGRNNLLIGSNFCQTAWYGAGYYWYWSAYRWISAAGQHTYV